MKTRLSVGLLVVPMLFAATAAAQAYRWVDETGSVYYAGSVDQVPEQYRSQLTSVGEPGEAGKPGPVPVAGAGPQAGAYAAGGCTLMVQGTQRRPGTSRPYTNCDECRKALESLQGDDQARAACIAGSQ
jgi:hypothetical protein